MTPSNTFSDVDAAVPHAPRTLSRSECSRLDVYLFHSPKLHRRVSVVGAGTLALVLELEFDASVVVYVERPRTLSLPQGQIELTVWQRHANGVEQFQWLEPATATHSSVAETRRDSAIVAAARIAQLSLRLTLNRKYKQQPTLNANRLRLLPYVQVARGLPAIDLLRDRVLALFEMQARLSFSRIETSLAQFDSRDVRAAVCDLIHRNLLHTNLNIPLNSQSLVESGGAK